MSLSGALPTPTTSSPSLIIEVIKSSEDQTVYCIELGYIIANIQLSGLPLPDLNEKSNIISLYWLYSSPFSSSDSGVVISNSAHTSSPSELSLVSFVDVYSIPLALSLDLNSTSSVFFIWINPGISVPLSKDGLGGSADLTEYGTPSTTISSLALPTIAVPLNNPANIPSKLKPLPSFSE